MYVCIINTYRPAIGQWNNCEEFFRVDIGETAEDAKNVENET